MKAVAISLLLLCTVALLNASGGSAQTSLSLKRHPHKYLVDHQARVHRSQLKTPPRFRAGSVIPLSGGLLSLGYYYVPITVGTPAVEFNVLLDTGSSNLALSSDACDSTCKSSSAPFYSPDQSSTGSPLYFHTAECSACNPDGSASNCAFGQPYPSSNGQFCGYGISYGGGSSYVSGYIGYDDVTFGGYTVNASIIVMTSQLPSGSLTSAPISGILGLAHEMNAVNPTWAPTIFGQIAQQYQLTNLFGLCLNSSTGGSLDLGAYESSRFSGSLQWVPVVEQRWYNMQMLDVFVGSTSLGMPTVAYAFNNDQIGTFIDSGTSALLFGPSAMGSLTSIFQSQYCSLPLVCGSQTIFTGACISDSQMQGYLSKFPALTFVFAGENGQQVKLSIGADSYFFHQNGQYCLAISAVPGIGAVLGDVFMENFYIVHDRANRRIGFAPVTNC